MQKKNSVIKNYILSPDKYYLKESHFIKPTEISLYHAHAMQNKGTFYFVLLRK